MREDLARRAETCFLRAWPALREIEMQGWLLRFAGGVSRRANSVNPLRTTGGDFADRIARCEAHYAEDGLPTSFRVHDLAEPGLDDALAQRNYAAEGETLTLCRDLSTASPSGTSAELAARASAEWVTALGDAQGLATTQRATYARIIARLDIPAVFAAVRKGGAVASVAYGALYDGLVAVESVATVPAARGLGLARQAVGAVLSWAEAREAESAILQVAASNSPAFKLYASLGFAAELYRYHYRRQPR